MPLPACLRHCNGGHVEIGLAPRPINTTTPVGCGRAYHGYQCRGHRVLRVAGRGGGGGRRSPAGKGHGGHPAVARGTTWWRRPRYTYSHGIPAGLVASPRAAGVRQGSGTYVNMGRAATGAPPRVPRGRGMRVGPARTGHRGVSRLARHRYIWPPWTCRAHVTSRKAK